MVSLHLHLCRRVERGAELLEKMPRQTWRHGIGCHRPHRSVALKKALIMIAGIEAGGVSG
jgi:hypothetical protein